MHFSRKVTFGTLFSLALAASHATAQEKSFKEAIIGPWVITSVFDEYQTGEKEGPAGLLRSSLVLRQLR